jgi:hypothetical protein
MVHIEPEGASIDGIEDITESELWLLLSSVGSAFNAVKAERTRRLTGLGDQVADIRSPAIDL